MRLVTEYLIKKTNHKLHTTQEFSDTEETMKYIMSRPFVNSDNIMQFSIEKTPYGKCDTVLAVDGGGWVKYYYLFP